VVIELIVTLDDEDNMSFHLKNNTGSQLLIDYVVVRQIRDSQQIKLPIFIIVSLGVVLGVLLIVLSIHFIKRRKRQLVSF
jgi:hypothetical protein